MDKNDVRDKRRQDKYRKKVPPTKPGKQTGAPKPPEVQHTAPLVVCDQRYGKRQVQQNWTADRDLPSEDIESEDEQLNAADFEKLLTVPPSTGGHFLLSSEKHWLTAETNLPGEDKKNNYSEYFRIDTKLLNASLASIPFYERQGYDQRLFSAEELKLMHYKAELGAETYKKLSKEHVAQSKMIPVKPPKPVPCLIGKHAVPKDVTEHIGNNKLSQGLDEPVEVRPVESNLNDLKIENPVIVQNVPASSTNSNILNKPDNTPQATKNETKEDIQQWLDDILDI